MRRILVFATVLASLGIMRQSVPLMGTAVRLIPCAMIAVPAPVWAQAGSAADIDKHIRGLSYDPLSLLSVMDQGSTLSMPGKSNYGNAVIICSNTKKKLSMDFDSITILAPTAGVVYPGALVKANRNLAEGRPDGISLARAPMKLSVDLPGLGADGVVTVEDASNSAVQAAADGILRKWYGRGLTQAARQSLEVKKAYSQEQISLALGFSARWVSNNLKTSMSVNTSSKHSTAVAMFRQTYYTVTMDMPRSPSAVFAPEVTLAEIREVASGAYPPAYVKSVDYGRIIFVKLETDSSETEADLQGTLKFVTGSGVTTDSNLKAKYEKITNNSTFTALTLGGNAQTATQVFDSGNTTGLVKLIQDSATFSERNPGVPIAYSVNFLKDNALARMASTTDYTEWNCTEFPSGYIKLFHAGAYIARFRVTWQEKDERGEKGVNKSWSSGNQTAGWSHTLNLPGDAANVRIKGEAKTGLLWNPWGEIINKVENGPTNKCYKAVGTTLIGRGWNNDCR